MKELIEIEQPHYSGGVAKIRITLPSSVTPLKLLSVMNEKDYEDIVHEWAFGYLKNKYEKVCHLGGTGDKGRDIAAYYDYKKNKWDNYQCKYYEHKLNVNEILTEIGKLCYLCYIGELALPQKYYFVSPKGVSTQVHDILKNPENLRGELKTRWDTSCKTKITKSKSIELDKALSAYIDAFDFGIFDYLEPIDFIEQYKQTSYFATRFGVITKARPIPQPAPEDIQKCELVYIKKILEAYGDSIHKNIKNAKELDKFPALKADFERQRRCFFSAESLKAFSRDISDPDLKWFENLKEEIYSGIIDTIDEDAAHGFERLKKVLKRATELQITNNLLIPDLKIDDRKGICHHLANEKKEVKWKK